MASLYGSNEVYKVFRKDGEKKITAVEGLYVVGQHLELVYQNPCVMITSISVSPAEVYDYTTRYVDNDFDGTIGVIDFQINNNFILDTYTRAYDSTFLKDGTLGAIDFSIQNDFVLYRYTRQYDSSFIKDGTCGLQDFSITTNYVHESITTKVTPNYEPSVRMTDLSVTALEYE